MTPLARRLARTTLAATLAAALGIGLLALVAPARSEPVGVPVPVFRGGTVTSWGTDNHDQNQLPPSLTGKTVTAVADGGGHSLALTSDGVVIAWGRNDDGQATVPESLDGQTVVAISAGGFHSLALTSDGTITAWGDNTAGQTTVPASLAGKTVTAVSAGEAFSLALTSDGTITAWGTNFHGQTNIPPSLAGKTVTAVAAGMRHSLALTSDGTITAWGRNSDGQASVPDSLTGKTVTAIAGGDNHSVALTSDGTVTAWGDSSATGLPQSLTGKTVTAIDAGDYHSLALTADGDVHAWGRNLSGESTVPDAVSGQIATAIAAGGSHSLAIATDFKAERAPIVTGTPATGRPLTADPGRYIVTPDQLAFTWYAGGAPVGTGATYTPTRADLGKSLTVQVTATKTGRPSVVTTSAPTAPVAWFDAPAIDLTAQPTSLRRGQSTQLTWTSAGATTVTAGGDWTGDRTPAGTLTVKPTRIGTTTYTLTATNAHGTTTARVQLQVTRPATRLRVKTTAKATVGRKLKVTVRGLERGERYTIRIGKLVLAKGTAKTAKPVVRKVKLPKKAGRVTLRVTGDQPDRTGTVRVRG